MFVWCHIVIFGAIFATASNQPAEKVTLEQVGDYSGCPGDLISFKCSVRSSKLAWKCPDGRDRVIQCSNNASNVHPLICQNNTLTVHFLHHGCTSNQTMITSTLQFSTSSYSMTCEDVDDCFAYKTTTIPLEVPPAPVLNISDEIKGFGDINSRIITIFWHEPESVQGRKYNITVEPAVQGCNDTCVTEQQKMELKLSLSTAYNVTARTVECNGRLQSTESEPLHVFLKVPPAVASCNATSFGKKYFEVQWTTLHDMWRLRYRLTSSVDGDIISLKNVSNDCTSICIYNITEKSVRNISVTGVNDIGTGEKTLCTISSVDSSNGNEEDHALLFLLLLLLLLLLPLPLLLLLCKEDKSVQEQVPPVVLRSTGEVPEDTDAKEPLQECRLDPIDIAVYERQPSTKRKYSSSDLMRLLFKQSKTMNIKIFFVAVCGLPHSGKSTLLDGMIPENASNVRNKWCKRSLRRRIEGMDVYELGYLLNTNQRVSNKWLDIDGDILRMYMLTYAFAEDGIELEQWTTPSDQFKSSLLNNHFRTVFEGMSARLEDIKHGRLENILHHKIAVMNVWDIGISRALYDVLPLLSTIFGRRLLINVLDMERDKDNLSKQPDVHKLDSEKDRDVDIMRLHSRLHYYLRIAGCARKAKSPSALLVGTHRDSEAVDEESIEKLKDCIWLKVDDMGISSLVYPEMLVVNANDKNDCATVRETLETIVNDLNELEYDMPLSWIFLRTALYHYPFPDSSSFLITREELKNLASEVGITTESEIEKFLEIFSHAGSIIYHTKVNSLHENVILSPERFLQTLSKLYTSSEQEDDWVSQHREGALKKGIVCTRLTHVLWENEEDREFLVHLALDAMMAVELKSDDHGQSSICPTCNDEECYFMPTLRDVLSLDCIKSESDSLFVMLDSGYVPTEIQGMFVKHIPVYLQAKLELKPTDTYNQTILSLPEVSGEITITITVHGKALEINLKSPSCSQKSNRDIKGALKTACVDILEKFLQYYPDTHYQLGVLCLGSDISENSTLEGLHFLPCVHREMLCIDPQCRKPHKLGQLQLEWIDSDYLEPPKLMRMPEAGYINDSELNKVIQSIPLEKIPDISTALGIAVEVNQSDVIHCIDMWQRSSNSNRKDRLFKLLFDIGCYEAAMKLDATYSSDADLKPVNPAEMPHVNV